MVLDATCCQGARRNLTFVFLPIEACLIRQKEEKTFEGIAVSPGLTLGHARIVNRSAPPEPEPRDLADDEVETEVERFMTAVNVSRAQLQRIREQVARAIDEKHADIISAQSMFLHDVELIDRTVDEIRSEKKNADYLFKRRIDQVLAVFQKFEDQFIKARDIDIVDICNRLLGNMSSAVTRPASIYDADVVIVAHDLAPSDATLLLKSHVKALVLEKGGPTSHTAILAKAVETPALVGVSNITTFVQDGDPIIVDALQGRVIIHPGPESLAAYEAERGELAFWEKELSELRDQEAETSDGYAVSLRANIELPEELEHIANHGAKGIGLYRTEFLFLNRDEPPGEEEQFQTYRRAVEAVKPHSVVFRTLDIGGDKFVRRAPDLEERNPFLGQRAVRLCLQHPEMFRAQLRAMLRASCHGKTRILIPMISGLEEFLEVKKQLRQAKDELRQARVMYDPDTELGAMIEVPSAAIVADMLAHECDFFSIGTNDLIQYGLAVDRGNEHVAYLYEPLHPAILRLLRTTINAGRDAGIPVSVCGEVAADPLMAVILVGLGADELSMSALCLPPVKRIIRSIKLADAKQLAEEIMTQPTVEGIKSVIRRRMRQYIVSSKASGWLRFARSTLQT